MKEQVAKIYSLLLWGNKWGYSSRPTFRRLRYGNIKTAHHIFESGIIQRERASELAGMTVEFEGKYYEIGSTHKEYQMDKVWDEDYYILTLAALAKERK